jgi:hypothetical protein
MGTEPALDDLRLEVKEALAPVRDRVEALALYEQFDRDRDEALFHATLARGQDFQTELEEARTRGRAALDGIGFSPPERWAAGAAPRIHPG